MLKKHNKLNYQEVISLDNLKKGLTRTKSNIFPGLEGLIKANFTDKKLNLLSKELKSQRFKPFSVKRVNIPKPSGGVRPLGIASQKDKIVQAAILNLLEPILEEVFLDCSYGGRPNRNCHSALKHIKTKWQDVTWIINIYIQKCFDTINYEILLSMLEKYCDQALIELIKKLLKSGYVDLYNHPNVFEKSETGTPQGSFISPIFLNLFFHHFDCFVTNELLSKWNRGNERKFIPGYQTCKRLTSDEIKAVESLNLKGAKEAIEKLKYNKWVKQNLSARDLEDETFRRMGYIRYVDDFLIGFTGTKVEAEEIKNRIELFLADELKLKTNKAKSYISHSSDRGIKYLGFYIRYLSRNKVVIDSSKPYKNGTEKGHLLKTTAINQVQLRIPVEEIMRRAAELGYARIRKDGISIRATSCRKFSSLEDKQIVQRFSSIIRGLMEYYSPANRRSDLWQIVSLYRKSCALTLADKHKLKTAAKVFKKYGPNLKISDPIQRKETVLFYPSTLKTIANFKLGKSDISLSEITTDPIEGFYESNKKMAETCQWPGCKNTDHLKEHHINSVRNINSKSLSQYKIWLKKKARKTITLCREHHFEVEKLTREKPRT